MQIVMDEYFEKAFSFLENAQESLFLTGRAGTGKSTLLSYFIEHTKKNIVVLAPTGVAALNVKGETIHSFFHFKPGVTLEDAKKEARKVKKKEFYQSIEIIIIDEISMVRADLLDCVDIFLKTLFSSKKPFGGIRMVFIGDLYQLPPVVSREDREYFEQMYESPYFFSSQVMKDRAFRPRFIELEKIYRQSDEIFISILNSIRKNSLSEEELIHLNKRSFLPEKDEGCLYLTTTNASATKINEEKLAALQGRLYEYEADMEGDFDPKASPTDCTLKLKVGAQVIFLTNQSEGLWVNGTLGKVVSISQDRIFVQTEEGQEVAVKRFNWTLYKYDFDAKSKKLCQEEVGSFHQYPLKLAWALTIHKAQGKSFDKVILDLERGSFAHGQTYVALSRCRSIEGVFLKKPLQKSHILMDYRVVSFLTEYQYALSEENCSIEEKVLLIEQAIRERRAIQMVYLKRDDQKSNRKILPQFVGEMEYNNKKYLGIKAYCTQREEDRIFRVDRILELSIV
jgi:ATP-dependent exoDNAse (exonuclease V) alpha subunit